MENIGAKPATSTGTVHGPNGYTFSGTYQLPHGNFSDNFHTFAMRWDPGSSTVFFCGIGTTYATLDKNFSQQPAKAGR